MLMMESIHAPGDPPPHHMVIGATTIDQGQGTKLGCVHPRQNIQDFNPGDSMIYLTATEHKFSFHRMY